MSDDAGTFTLRQLAEVAHAQGMRVRASPEQPGIGVVFCPNCGWGADFTRLGKYLHDPYGCGRTTDPKGCRGGFSTYQAEQRQGTLAGMK